MTTILTDEIRGFIGKQSDSVTACDTVEPGAASDGLPELPLPGRALLNGGSEIEFLRYARHGERVIQRSRYADIYERDSKNGPMLFVVVETEYSAGDGDVLLRVRKTIIRR